MWACCGSDVALTLGGAVKGIVNGDAAAALLLGMQLLYRLAGMLPSKIEGLPGDVRDSVPMLVAPDVLRV